MTVGRSRHVVLGFAALAGVVIVGTVGYVVLGFGVLDAVYQTVTTITTVGFREVEPLDGAGQIFTIVLILAGVGTALYTLTVGLEALVEGHIGEAMGRRRMDKQIGALDGHVIVCGWGRVGRAAARELESAGKPVVVIDSDAERAALIPRSYPHVHGDASDDDVLDEAGIDRAAALVAAVSTDAANLFITLSGRSLRSDLFIVSRAREESSVNKLLRAGADRVVNPQEIGGARIAAFVSRPRVTDFLDVVMHTRETELVLEEISLAPESQLVGLSLGEAKVRDRTGALVLAVHDPTVGLVSNPGASVVMNAGQTLLAIGTPAQLENLTQIAGADATASRPPERTTASTAPRIDRR
jgi:voltage-gated potassium channel